MSWEIVMVCNTEVSALDKCNELVGWMQGFMDSDWLPIPDIGDTGRAVDGCLVNEDAPGTCEMELPFLISREAPLERIHRG